MNRRQRPIRFGMIKLALDTLRRRPLRSVIAMLSIAVALGGALVLVGATTALEATLESGYDSRRVDLIVLQANKSNPMSSRLPEALAAEIEGLEGVRQVQALLVDSLILGDDQSLLVYGWPADYPELRRQTSAGTAILANGEVLIGQAAAAISGIEPGTEIELNLGSFQVVGTFEGTNFFESGVIYMRLDDLQELIGSRDQVTYLFIEAQTGASRAAIRDIAERIEQQFPAVHALSAERFVRDNQLSGAVRGLSRVILLTSVCLSILIISTIMILTISERRRELAVLRAIGWSSRRVAVLVGMETAMLATGAALAGNLIGWVGLHGALAYLQNQGLHAQALLTFDALLWPLFGAVAVAVLGAALPVYHTLSIKVSEALIEQ